MKKRKAEVAVEAATLPHPFPPANRLGVLLGTVKYDRAAVAQWWAAAAESPEAAAREYFAALPFGESLAGHPGGVRLVEWCAANWTEDLRASVAPMIDGRFIKCLESAGSAYLSPSTEADWSRRRAVSEGLAAAHEHVEAARAIVVACAQLLDEAATYAETVKSLQGIAGWLDDYGGRLDFQAWVFGKELESHSMAGHERRMAQAAKDIATSRRGAAIRYLWAEMARSGVPQAVAVTLLVGFFFALGGPVEARNVRSVVSQAMRTKQRGKSK